MCSDDCRGSQQLSTKRLRALSSANRPACLLLEKTSTIFNQSSRAMEYQINQAMENPSSLLSKEKVLHLAQLLQSPTPRMTMPLVKLFPSPSMLTANACMRISFLLYEVNQSIGSRPSIFYGTVSRSPGIWSRT